jgi:hypothetical protein
LRPEHARPETLGADWLASLFFELSTCRALGPGGFGPIPVTAIWAGVDRYGLPQWSIDAVISIDAAWLTRQRKAAPGAAGSEGA